MLTWEYTGDYTKIMVEMFSCSLFIINPKPKVSDENVKSLLFGLEQNEFPRVGKIEP